jgi:carboxylate-amine ligase
MEPARSYSLFEVIGIEIEYMIVDRDTLQVKPVADLLLSSVSGNGFSDFTNDGIGWSNELVNHVIELKTAKPVPTLNGTSGRFAENIRQINSLLEKHNAMLLPTAMHPFMDPPGETVLWQHENKEIYALYDRIFGCRSHGWANLQSVHLNLPFTGDEEFGKLHAATRLLLPLIPAIAASSPLRENKLSGYLDSRMQAYLTNQRQIPSLMGNLIPEAVFTQAEYHQRIFNPIRHDIEPWDKDRVMDHHFLNSRGAIARFDRGSIEIRVTDTQECPLADLAIASLIKEVLKYIIEENYSGFGKLVSLNEMQLLSNFNAVIREGEKTVITDNDFLEMIGITEKAITASEVWQKLFQDVSSQMSIAEAETIRYILTKGSLSSRIIEGISGKAESERIHSVYSSLAQCLHDNKLFLP